MKKIVTNFVVSFQQICNTKILLVEQAHELFAKLTKFCWEMEELFTVGKHQKFEMETEKKHPAELSNSGVERAVSGGGVLNFRFQVFLISGPVIFKSYIQIKNKLYYDRLTNLRRKYRNR